MAKNIITYSPSIYALGSFEVLAGGLLVGSIESAGSGFVARPHRNKCATFGTLDRALEYFSKIFVCVPDTNIISGEVGKPITQLSIF